nr:alcohol dehydrogenase 1 [Helicoverpa armigera]
MARGRYATLTRYCLTNNVLQNKKQLCLRRSRSHQTNTKVVCPQEVYQKLLFSKIGLVSCIQENFYRSCMYDWNGAVMLVTGTRGIGAHIVRFGLEQGVKNVTSLDIDERSGLALQYELNHKYGEKDKVKFISCDFTDVHQLMGRYQEILCDKNETFVVINDAELLNNNLCQQQSGEERNTIATGLVLGNLTALDLMRMDKYGRGGTIINISSAFSLCPTPLTSENTSTKHSVMTMCIGLGNDEFFRRTGVRVITVCYEASDPKYENVSQNESEPRFSTIMSPCCNQCPRTAARAIIEIFKHGSSGSIWVIKDAKPIEDITYIVKKSYSTHSFETPMR